MENTSPIQRYEYDAGFIQLTEEGYFFVEMKNGSVSTIDTIKQSHVIMTDLLPEGPVFILVNSGLGSTSENDIYDYLNKSEFKKRVKAQAIIVHDLATRLMGNIFLRFLKNQRDVKIFSSTEDARKWVLSRMQDYSNDKSKSKGSLIAY